MPDSVAEDIGITRIGAYVPEARISNLERAAEFSVDEDFIRNKLGVEDVSRMSVQEDTADIAFRAWEDISHGVDTDTIECVVVCTQNPHGNGIPHTSAVLHGMIGLPDHCACFDISLGCSGYVYGLSIIKSFMISNGMKSGVLITADPYSKTLNPEDRNTALLFGDAATATMLGENPVLVPHQFTFGTSGRERQALNNDKGMLEMNGRAVFGFSSTRVPRQVAHLLESAGVDQDDIDLFLFHQGSRFIVEKLADKLGLPADKVPVNLTHQGNTVSSSIPLLLKQYLNDPRQRNLVLSGFGVGLSWASCLATRNTEIPE